MCLMLCAPLDRQYAELPSSASDEVLYSVFIDKKKKVFELSENYAPGYIIVIS